MGEGRFGPVFLADDVAGEHPVVVRVFERVDATVADALLEALELLCSSPLDHPAIARPIACGSEGGSPFLVHSYLPGTSLDEFLAQHGPQPLSRVVIRVAQVAASIDFAAAARVHHGVLGARDIILNDDGAGVTGLGLVQALSRVGIHVPGAAASHADDIYALAAIAYQLLTGLPYRGVLDGPLAEVDGGDPAAIRNVLASALAIDSEVRPASALDFARALQSASPFADTVRATPATIAEAINGGAVDIAHVPMAAPLTSAADLAADTVLRGATADSPSPPEATTPLRVLLDAPVSVPPAATSGRPVFLAVAVALLAAVAGFAGGFTVGQRSVSSVPSGPEPQAATASSPLPKPEGTQGRTFTDAPIDERSPVNDRSRPNGNADGTTTGPTSPAAAPAAPRPTPTPPTPAPAPPRPAAAPTAAAPAATAAESTAKVAPGTPGSMEVLSRPTGAEVFVDGALVGRTPLSLPGVEAGGHAVRIALPGHQRWVTSVEVRPGERTRVAASLELVTDPQ
jgi:hypothetical protein